MKDIRIKTKLFVLIHYCLLVTIIAGVWLYFDSYINSLNWIEQGSLTLITGIGAIGIWALTIPTINKVEDAYIKLSKEETK